MSQDIARTSTRTTHDDGPNPMIGTTMGVPSNTTTTSASTPQPALTATKTDVVDDIILAGGLDALREKMAAMEQQELCYKHKSATSGGVAAAGVAAAGVASRLQKHANVDEEPICSTCTDTDTSSTPQPTLATAQTDVVHDIILAQGGLDMLREKMAAMEQEGLYRASIGSAATDKMEDSIMKDAINGNEDHEKDGSTIAVPNVTPPALITSPTDVVQVILDGDLELLREKATAAEQLQQASTWAAASVGVPEEVLGLNIIQQESKDKETKKNPKEENTSDSHKMPVPEQVPAGNETEDSRHQIWRRNTSARDISTGLMSTASTPGAVAVPGIGASSLTLSPDTGDNNSQDNENGSAPENGSGHRYDGANNNGGHAHHHHHHHDHYLVEAELVPQQDDDDDIEKQQPPSEEKSKDNNDDQCLVIAQVAPKPVNQKRVYMAFAFLVVIIGVLATVVVVATTKGRGEDAAATSTGAIDDTTMIGINTSSSSVEEESSLLLRPPHIGNTIIGAAPSDNFGMPLALSTDGSLVAVGARTNGNMGFESGLVRVFVNTPSAAQAAEHENKTVWRLMGTALAGQDAGDQFGFSGLALSTTAKGSVRIAAGAPFHNVTTSTTTSTAATKDANTSELILEHAGHVRIFDLSPDQRSWIPVGSPLDGVRAGDWFGRAVAMSDDGSIVAAAAYQSSEFGNTFAGHVRVFQESTDENNVTSWQPMGSTLLGRAAYDRLGRSLDMSADGLRLAMGATQFRGNGSGYVQVMDFNGTDWIQVGQDLTLTEKDRSNVQDGLGRDVALSSDGSILACGGNFADTKNGESSGLVRVYHLVDHQWEPMGDEAILGTAAEDYLGVTLALSSGGTRVSIGATQKRTGAGYVRILDYDPSQNVWNPVGPDINGDHLKDKFGSEVQLSADGTVLAVGAPDSDANGGDSGQVQVFDLQYLS